MYNSLLVLAYLRKSCRFLIWFVFANLVAETRNEIIHKTVGSNLTQPFRNLFIYKEIILL